MPDLRVAAIDIGSNSIKILVAARAPDGSVLTLHARAIEARISAGISQQRPRLSETGMTRGLEAICSLLADAKHHGASRCVLVATSAVRDAENGVEFRGRVQAATSQSIRILTGEEEANLIGRGLTCDPALRPLRDFYSFDLGGGSLECLAFRGRQVQQAISLPLGCVRLTEKCVADSRLPFTAAANGTIAAEVQEHFARAAFAFDLPDPVVAVGTGGTITTARAVIAARDGRTLETTSPEISVTALRQLLDWVGPLPLTARREIKGLPPARADVFPTALATLIALAAVGRFNAYHHSLYNLRYGLAAEALGAE
jgi:exopolyphosphatase/guanosine-5'-triphosphate,3'-diphosphate pyrophosphatase